MIRSAPYRCIYSNDEITAENNSRAHIFPNAIGGKLKPKDILTQKSNQGNIKKIEDEFIDLFKGFLALIDPVRDRGRAPRYHYVSELNEKYIQSHGGVFLEHVRTENIPYSRKYECHKKIFGNVPRIKRQQDYDWGKIIAALYVFSNIFFAYKGGEVGRLFKKFVDKPNLIIDFAQISLCSLSRFICRDGDAICHTAIIFSDENNKSTCVYVEIFEMIAAIVYFPYTEGIVSNGYSIDITRGSECEFDIKEGFYGDLILNGASSYLDDVVIPAKRNLLIKIRNKQFAKFIAEVFRECIGGVAYSEGEFALRLRLACSYIEERYMELKSPRITKK